MAPAVPVLAAAWVLPVAMARVAKWAARAEMAFRSPVPLMAAKPSRVSAVPAAVAVARVALAVSVAPVVPVLRLTLKMVA